jgi:hypothetical protein
MIRTDVAGALALFLGLLITLMGSPTPGQEPTQSRDANGGTIGSPLPAAAQSEPEPSAAPFPGPAIPDAVVEPFPPALPPIEASQAVQAPPPDAFAPSTGGFSPFMNPVVGRAPVRTDYWVVWLPAEPVAGQPTNLGYVQQDFALSFPLWQCAGADEWLGSINFRNETFHTHAILPDTRQPFPEDLWNIRFGTTYRHLFENGWIAGGTLTVGSASDKPFHSIDEMTAGINAFLRIPQGEHNAWLLSLSYSPVSELPYPIPGVAFMWQPSENFRANLGLPFQVMWRPVEDLTLDLSYMLLTTFHARATYRLCRSIRFYVAYATENEAYLLADRVDVNDRFFNVDQRVTAGAQVNISPRAALDLSSGYVFDHHFFEGKNITNGTNFNRVDVGDGTFVSLQFRIRW